jgi:hypothetical protein
MSQTFASAVAAVGALIFALGTNPEAQRSESTTERFIAGAINPNHGGTGMVEIVVDRWSTNAERERLMSVAFSKGPGKLLDVLQELPKVGYFRTPDRTGWDLRFARRTPGEDGGEHIVLATDRRVGYWETVVQPPSFDYPFTVIELHLNGDGRGEGRMSFATKVVADRKTGQISLENYEHQPVLLTDVHRERS